MKNYNYVNPRMGSENSFKYSNGNCYPACAVPHGMNFFTIQTGFTDRPNWFYSPRAKSFEGIRLTHMPSPWLGDYGKLLIYGQHNGKLDKRNYWVSYDAKNVVFEPAYIKASIKPDNYDIEITPTERAAILRLTFREGSKNRVVFAGEELTYNFSEDDNSLLLKTTQCDLSRNMPIEKRQKFVEYITVKPSVKCSVEAIEGKVSLLFDGTTFECKLATSYISKDLSELNLEREISDKTFDEVRSVCECEWNDYLSRIDIEDPDEEKKATFYSCMYRAFLWPIKFYEIDKNGHPIHLNMSTFEPTEGYLYTNNGFWDTYRTLYPYLSLIDTDLYREMAEGFYNFYVDTGWLPKWVCPFNVNCMPGMLIEATMGDAIVKNIVEGDLAEKIFSAMMKDGEYASDIPGVGRVGLKEYRALGYIPYTVAKESVNETLDNTLGDFAIAMSAKKLGKNDIAERYFAYSQNYKHLFDSETGFMRGKDEFGNFRDEVFNPYFWGRDYTEGSAWQNGFGVYHDIKGLNELYRGKLANKIDELMTAPTDYYVGSYGCVIHEMIEMVEGEYGQCAISNQPSFHIPYIYSELGDPAKTSYHVAELAKRFDSGFEGFPGDEDNGTTSCWYLLSAMGLYQVAPSRPDFATSLPLFDKMTVKLSGGNVLNIEKEKYELDKMTGNVSYFDVMAGGDLANIVKNK